MALAFSVNTNPSAFTALQALNGTNRDLTVVQNRINTGLKVAGAKDDSAIFAIAQNLRSDLGGLNAIKQSLDRASGALDVGIAAAEAISDLLIEAKERRWRPPIRASMRPVELRCRTTIKPSSIRSTTSWHKPSSTVPIS